MKKTGVEASSPSTMLKSPAVFGANGDGDHVKVMGEIYNGLDELFVRRSQHVARRYMRTLC